MSKATEENKQKITIKKSYGNLYESSQSLYWKFMCTDKNNDKAK